MPLNKWVVVGLVGALGVGFLALAVPPSASSEEPNASVNVPVGRIGDTVSFDDHWSDKGVQDCKPDPCESWEGSGVSQVTFRVNGTGRTVDRTGQERRALEILSNRTYTQAEQTAGHLDKSSQSQSYLNLGTRAMVRYDQPSSSPGGCVVPENPVDRSCPYRGPYVIPGRHSVRSTWDDAGADQRFRFQGKTYAMGQDVTDEVGPADLGNNYLLMPENQDLLGGVDLTYRSWVGEWAVVDGHRAVAVHSDLRLSHSGTSNGYVFQETDIFRHVAWLSSDAAYPVRLEYANDWRWDGVQGSAYAHLAMNYSTILVLRSVQPGVQEIPWEENPGPEPVAKMVPGLERAPDGRHYPTDGVGSSLAYGLEDAIRNVGADPTLASYQSWVAANPRRVLVGALFGQGIGHLDVGTTTEMDRPQHTWTLAFGVPGGGAYVVESKRDFDTGAIANWDSGEARIRGNNGVIPMDVHNLLPERPITLAQAQRFLRGAWGPAVVGREGYDPSQVWWGYPILSARFVLGGADSTDQRPQVTVYDGALQELGIARGKYWPSRAPGSDPGRWDRLLIGVDSGILSVGWSSSTWYNYEVPARAVDSLVHPSSPLASGGGAPAALADRLPLAGWAATSAFVLFLFAYFYPFLKFTGTGLLGAFPGYAKLHKSDLLNNKVREQMLQLIKADPGITPPQLQAHVQAGWSTVVYHLGVLEKNQLVSSLIDGRHKRFFPVGEIDHGKRGVVAALKNERTKQLYEIVLEEPGVIQKELIRRLGISQPSTMWHVKRLEAVGLLGHDKQKREVHYFANPKETLVEGYDPKAAVEVA